MCFVFIPRKHRLRYGFLHFFLMLEKLLLLHVILKVNCLIRVEELLPFVIDSLSESSRLPYSKKEIYTLLWLKVAFFFP